MTYNIQVYHISGSNSTNISSYIIDSDKVPLYERNRTWEPVISEFDMEITQAYLIPIAVDDVIQIYFDDNNKYNFNVVSIKKNYEKRTYKLTLKKNLYQLQKLIINNGNLNSYLENTSDTMKFVSADNFGYTNYQVLWVMESMFSASGLTLDVSSVATESLGTFFLFGWSGENTTVRAQDLKVDGNMLYQFGTGQAAQGGQYAPFWDKRKDCWSYVKEVCTHFGWAIQNKNSPNDYKLIPMYNLTNFSVANSYKYSYDLDEYEAKHKGGVYRVQTAFRPRYWQTSQSANLDTSLNIEQEYDDKIENAYKYSMPDSFRFLIREKRPGFAVNSGSVVPGDFDGLFWRMFYPYGGAYGCNRRTIRDAQINPYKIEKIETALTVDINKKFLSLKVDLKNRTSLIEQEIIIE